MYVFTGVTHLTIPRLHEMEKRTTGVSIEGRCSPLTSLKMLKCAFLATGEKAHSWGNSPGMPSGSLSIHWPFLVSDITALLQGVWTWVERFPVRRTCSTCNTNETWFPPSPPGPGVLILTWTILSVFQVLCTLAFFHPFSYMRLHFDFTTFTMSKLVHDAVVSALRKNQLCVSPSSLFKEIQGYAGE